MIETITKFQLVMIVKCNRDKILLFLAAIITGTVVLNGCAVDHGLDPDKYAKVYMPQARNIPLEYTVITGIDTIQTIEYGATYGGPSKPGSDISVSFKVNPALVDSFNLEYAAAYPILPKDAYELSKKSAIIPAGKKFTSELYLKIKGSVDIKESRYLLPITMNVNSGGVPLNKNLKTAYFLITTNKVMPLNTNIIITGMMVNSWGADSPEKGTEKYDFTVPGGMEYIQLMALQDIDFSQTPYSVVVGRHYGNLSKGWASGESTSFKFNLTEGQAKQGTYFYVGGAGRRIDGYRASGLSTDISDANWIRYLQTNIGDNKKIAGDGFGWSTSGLLPNGSKATGIAVFKGTNVTSSSVPVDAVFYGSEVDGALKGSNGYNIPKQSDLYSAVNKETGEKQPLFGQGTNTFMLKDAGDGNFRQLGGVFTENAILKPRSNDPGEDYGVNTKVDTKLEEIESGPEATKFKE